MNIYKILSGLKYNGTVYAKGDLIEGTEEEFASLISAGVLKLDDDTEEEVKEEETTQAPENTWGPKPDVPEEEKEVRTEATEPDPADAPEKKEGFLAGIFDGKKEDEKPEEVKESTEEVKVEEPKPEITGDNL